MAPPRALQGIRVVDFTWVRAGPWATRWLGALGAEVIKVEWPEAERGRQSGGNTTPQGVERDLNSSGNFNDTNANKLSLTLNVRTARGMDLVKRLISVSDVVIENFSSRVLRNWGLGYEALCELRPDIVYVSMSGFGHTGRHHHYKTFGPVAQAISGLTFLSGLPGKPPAGWGWSYLDDTGGLYGAMGVLTGIHRRDVTGQGQHIDLSQMITGITLNGPAILDHTVNGRPSRRKGFPPGNTTHWPGTPLLNNYRGPTAAPHNAYRTSPGGYNDWCVIACFSNEEWQRLVQLMGTPPWAASAEYADLDGRLRHQQAMDLGIEAWTSTRDKYELTKMCQEAGVRAMPVQSSKDRVEHDPQLRHRGMYRALEHPELGFRKLQNAPFELSATPAVNHLPGPLIGQHNRRVLEGILGLSREELVSGYEDGTFWPVDRPRYPYMEAPDDRRMSATVVFPRGVPPRTPRARPDSPPMETAAPGRRRLRKPLFHASDAETTGTAAGPLSGLTALELADQKGEFCGKLMADLGADVVKVEPPGGEATRSLGPFLDDVPHPDRSLSFWHYNTSKRGVTLDLESDEGRALFRRLASTADVVLETFAPGYLASLELGYEALSAANPKLIMCSLTPFGQSGPWRDYRSSDLLHMAAGGQMASSGYDDIDVPDAPPIAPGGGNAWHTGAHYAYIAIMAALVHRAATGEGQYIDASIHDACALSTESAVASYIYRDEVVIRQTGRHHAAQPTPRTQYPAKDGKYVNALTGGGRLDPDYVRTLAEWFEPHGLAGDLMDERYRDPEVIRENAHHIVGEVLANFIANRTAEEVYHEAQERRFPWGAVRAPDELLSDPHLDDRDFWTEVEHPELARAFTYPGGGAIFNGSPWRISRRAPLVGEHNDDIFGGALGLSREELARLSDNGVI